MVERIDIERALDKLAADESGIKFQSLAVVLAKLRWPDLIACERHNDRGLDAYAPASVSSDGTGRGLACSTTGTLDKLKSDANKVKEHYPDVSYLVYYTTQKVTQDTKIKWSDKISEAYGYDLVVVSREEVIASLQLPNNVQLCRTHLDIPIPYQAPVTDLRQQAYEAASVVTTNWAAHPRLGGKPRIALNAVAISRSGADTAEVIGIASIRTMLLHGRRVVLEGAAGRGKTTMLVQLAEVAENFNSLPLLIDLPNWVRSGKDILDYVADSPSFSANGIDAVALARLSKEQTYLFLLNGWNEITDLYSTAASDALRALERAFPTAGIMVATRTHYIVPPLPGARRLRLLPLNPQQRFGYLSEALGATPARDLNVILSSDPALDELTRTPFILSEVTALFRSEIQIPKTKVGLLKAVVDLMERSEEHAGHLQGPPLRSHAEHYLRALAIHLTARGDVSVDESEAKFICSSASNALRDTGQISALPEPADVLNVLTAHHILERGEYPKTSFRFEHQQFQEYYSALVLEGKLLEIVASSDPTNANLFARTYINDPSWEEPLRMIAADLGGRRNDVAAVKALILLALRVDAVFAGRLSHLAGPSVWTGIRDEMHSRLRALYESSRHQHHDYALAAILATGSDEFVDILIPLLTSTDQQVRLRAYRNGLPFHPSSLGLDWQSIVVAWPENMRAEFVSEMTLHQGLVEIGLVFARSDPSMTVKLAALNGLSWMGQHDAVAEILQSLSDADFEHVIQNFYREEIPPSIYGRALQAYQRLLANTTDPKVRLKFILALTELGQATTEQLKSELDTLTPDLIRQLSDHSLRPVIEILRTTDAEWLSQWVMHQVIQGALRGENWLSMILKIPQSLREQLLHRACTENLRRTGGGGVTAVLSAGADADIARAVFAAFRSHHRDFVADYQNDEKRSIDEQLRRLLHSIARSATIDGILDLLTHPPQGEDLDIICDLFMMRGAEEEETADGQLTQPQRETLRRYLKSAVRLVLTQDDFRGEVKGHLSSALAKVGNTADMPDVMEMVRADLERVRKGRAARAQGDRPAIAQGAPMSWSGWHTEALLHLGHIDSEISLFHLLKEPEYEVDAAWALHALAKKDQSSLNAVTGARFVPVKREFTSICSVAPGWRTVFDQTLRIRYAEAIRASIMKVLEESKTSDAKHISHYYYRLKELAKVLAELDPQGSVDLLIDVASLPIQSDGWNRVAILESIVFGGIKPSTDAALAIIDPVIAQFRKHGVSENDRSLLARMLSLLPFVDDPNRGITRLQEILLEFPLYWQGNGNLLLALAQCPDETGFSFLIDIPARMSDGAFQQIAKEWIEAIASCPLQRAKAVMFSFIDPDEQTAVGDRTLPAHAIELLAVQLAILARTESSIFERIIQLTTMTISGQQRQIIAKVIARLNSQRALVAGLNLIGDTATPTIPYEIHRAIEDIVLEKRPSGGSSYTLAPQGATDLKARLFEMTRNDPKRSKSAFALLDRIEQWRLEYGRPPSEPRHPYFDSGEIWPPITQKF